MKKRIFFYIILFIIIGVFAFFNYITKADPVDIIINDIVNNNNIITVNAKTKPYKKAASYSTEIIGNTCYITVYTKNTLTNKNDEFAVSFSNKNNSILYVYRNFL